MPQTAKLPLTKEERDLFRPDQIFRRLADTPIPTPVDTIRAAIAAEHKASG